MNKKNKTLVFSAGILIISIAVTSLVFMTEPEAKREGATKKTAMLVEVTTVSRGNFQPVVVATGNVQAAKDITLSPRVSGEVLSLSKSFTPGSFVKKGQTLLRIDPADYQNTLKLRESDLRLAKADLRVEMGRQDVATKDYELIDQKLSPENKALVLREPQLESAKANVAAAEASVDQARINLNRATIRSPFDAHIISRNVNTGSQIAAGANLGRLVGTDEYWVIANVPVTKINFLSFAENQSEEGTEVKIVNTSWLENQFRTGQLYRLIGALDDQTRLARIIIKVKDPLTKTMQNTNNPPLMIGTFVEVHIQAREIEDVVRLNRDYLRKDNKVWVMKEGKLEIREIAIAFQDAKYAYITTGLNDQDQIVISNLSTVVSGSPLRVETNENRDLKPGDDE